MTDRARGAKRKIKITDWTCDDEGRSNSSEIYQEICRHVENLISGAALDLIAGRADLTARIIVSNLAHVYGLKPQRIKTHGK